MVVDSKYYDIIDKDYLLGEVIIGLQGNVIFIIDSIKTETNKL